MVEQLISLGKAAEQRRLEIETARVLPKDLVEELKNTEILRLWVARDYGGRQSDLMSLMEAVQLLAYYNGSLAWVACVTGTGSLTSGYLEPDFAFEVFGKSDSMLGGFAAPVNPALKLDRGIQVSGRWGWGSGTSHCTSVIGGVMVEDDSATPPFPAVALFHPADVIWHDTWHTNGLKGTASGDYEVKDVFVPNGRWIPFPVKHSVVDAPLYRVSFYGALAAVVATVGLGLAQRALDEIIKLGKSKKPVMARKTLSEKPVIQYQLAMAEAKYHSAKCFLERTAKENYKVAQNGIPDINTKNKLRMASTNAVSQAADVVDWCYKIGGGSTIWDSSKLQEIYRDMSVVTQHGLIAKSTNEMVGKVSFGEAFNPWML